MLHKLHGVFTELIAKCLNRKHLDGDVVQATGIRSAAAKTLFPNVATTPAAFRRTSFTEEHVTHSDLKKFMLIRNRSTLKIIACCHWLTSLMK